MLTLYDHIAYCQTTIYLKWVIIAVKFWQIVQ